MSAASENSANLGKSDLWSHSYHGPDFISTRTFGFWLYMLSDALIFAALFASYGVLDHAYNAAGGPFAPDIVHPLNAYLETFVLFSSVLAYGLGMVALKQGSRSGVMRGLIASFVLGLVFLGLELGEFSSLIAHGAVPERSGFLSAFFTLVLAHGLHMVFGLLWMAVMMVQVARSGLQQNVVYRLLNLKLFWHFQALIWVCVFTFVYLQGVI